MRNLDTKKQTNIKELNPYQNLNGVRYWISRSRASLSVKHLDNEYSFTYGALGELGDLNLSTFP